MSDLTLRQDVMDELRWELSVDAAHIGASVTNGVVTLTGLVDTYMEKLQAVKATRRIPGVRAIADDIQIRHAFDKRTADSEIAGRASAIMDWDATVPANAVSITVRNGWVTLAGAVEWNFQRESAEENIRKLSGVRGVTNSIAIKPSVHAGDIKGKIEDALKRHAATEAHGIRVSIESGNRVVLEGVVDSLEDQYAAENAAWSTPGVRAVDTRLRFPDPNSDGNGAKPHTQRICVRARSSHCRSRHLAHCRRGP